MDMNGKTVMITGASRGIGAAAARMFATAGANVALLARSEAEIGALAGEIGAAALAIRCDVADYGAVLAAVETTAAHFGGVDVFIGNAGMIDPIGDLATIDPEAWGRSIDVNLKGVFNGMRAVMPVMETAGGGTIITISSGAASHALEGWSAYCSGKAGAAMLLRCADQEGRNKGLRIMGLSPGTVATEMQKVIKASGVGPVAKLEWGDHIPPEWVGKALIWMCSSAADAHLGEELSLRDEVLCATIGLQ
ncbi:MAG: SDR family oxidoreductase [Rhodobacterales bacterium]|nr:SDR family oxidoreductase [Rhodobacterales bacterium]